MKFMKYYKEYESYMIVKNFSDRTVESYLNQLSLFIRFLAEHFPRIDKISQITKDVIFDYIDYLLTLNGKKKDRPISNSTISRKIGALKSFFGFMIKHDFLLFDPAKDIEYPREEKPIPRVILTEKEVLEVIKSIKTDNPFGLRNRAIVELLYSNGIRTSELCKLKLSDVDFNEMVVFIQKGKGGKSRIVPMTQYAAHYINEYINKARQYFFKYNSAPKNDYLFLTKYGRPFNCCSMNTGVFVCIMRDCKLKKNITPYTFRHSIATQLIKRGVDIRFVQELLGHSSLNTTQKYCHLDISDLKKVHALYHPRDRD